MAARQKQFGRQETPLPKKQIRVESNPSGAFAPPTSGSTSRQAHRASVVGTDFGHYAVLALLESKLSRFGLRRTLPVVFSQNLLRGRSAVPKRNWTRALRDPSNRSLARATARVNCDAAGSAPLHDEGVRLASRQARLPKRFSKQRGGAAACRALRRQAEGRSTVRVKRSASFSKQDDSKRIHTPVLARHALVQGHKDSIPATGTRPEKNAHKTNANVPQNTWRQSICQQGDRVAARTNHPHRRAPRPPRTARTQTFSLAQRSGFGRFSCTASPSRKRKRSLILHPDTSPAGKVTVNGDSAPKLEHGSQ